MDNTSLAFFEECKALADNSVKLSLTAAVSNPRNPTRQASDFSIQPALDYLIEMGGKQVRPALVCAAAQLSEQELSPSLLAIPITAIELIHTYSLIHDDLPAMDDDDLRRGMPTLHKKFDEATAILVGDGLQTEAFSLIANAKDISDSRKVQMIAILAEAAGFRGMVGGQYLDIYSIGKELTLKELQNLHALKTGALIRAAVALGGIAANATEDQLAALDKYAEHIGLAFQVVDDIIDVEGTTESLGKTQGKDEAANKATYVKLLGLDGAKLEANRLLEAALMSLEELGDSADHLRSLARYIVDRNY
ncbi:MAG: farnesyl diphosphate synthase [Halioglobus sp.]